MFDAAGSITGIHLRRPDGAKFCVRGSKLGLFLPDGGACPADPGPLLLAEGLTDAVALATLGFRSAGRPSSGAGELHAVARIRRLGRLAPLVVVVADGDAPGRQGAESLARRLVAHAAEVRVIAPPEGIKDIRAWHQRGCGPEDIHQAIRSAESRRLAIRAGSKQERARR